MPSTLIEIRTRHDRDVETGIIDADHVTVIVRNIPTESGQSAAGRPRAMSTWVSPSTYEDGTCAGHRST
ncbi:hypothetical protein [Rhodococcus sp. B50]|uniref:hypothetical protein n=1 Tax=Rhodococcus sp. B50 TaxID=2682847 RepID=UPI001BD48976|nr:hypothetical protein [Rhodococcus sp. B50]MBS9372223.1 hypothetical protein [Rhodococcus sp. B50]